MRRWLAYRLLHALATIAIAVVIVFFIVRLVPGDPLSRLTGDRPISMAERTKLERLYGLDQPVLTQFGTFLRALAHGDLGVSIAYGRPVTALIAERLPATLLLTSTALLLTFTLGVWLGVQQAVRRGSLFDRVVDTLSITGYAMPSFWLGILLAGLFGIRWHVLPVAGIRDPLLPFDASWATRAGDVLRHLILPAITLTVIAAASVVRQQRAAMLGVLSQPFVRTARAKGLPERRVVWRHAWRNALSPILTILGLRIPTLVSGSVFIEAVFAWPGLGLLAANAVGMRDYPVLVGCTLVVAIAVVLGSLISDAAHALLDPRVQLE